MNDHFVSRVLFLDKRELFFTYYTVAGKILYLVGLAITHTPQFLHFAAKFMIWDKPTVYTEFMA